MPAQRVERRGGVEAARRGLHEDRRAAGSTARTDSSTPPWPSPYPRDSSAGRRGRGRASSRRSGGARADTTRACAPPLGWAGRARREVHQTGIGGARAHRLPGRGAAAAGPSSRCQPGARRFGHDADAQPGACRARIDAPSRRSRSRDHARDAAALGCATRSPSARAASCRGPTIPARIMPDAADPPRGLAADHEHHAIARAKPRRCSAAATRPLASAAPRT